MNNKTASPLNAFSVDVEDYFHASALADGVRRVGRENLKFRVCENTERVMGILDDAGVKGTFFVLGWVAERFAPLVRSIRDAGHEVACHGYSHALIYDQSVAEFREETLRAKGLLEDTIGGPVSGYRAASFSVRKDTLWALDVLQEAGFQYDSSIFPVHHDRYGIADAALEPHVRELQNGGSIVEVPMTVLPFGGVRIPVSGGGYFRLYPYAFTRTAARRVNASGRPWVFYIHPWEVDPLQPRLEVRGLSRFRHYNNLDKTEPRLRRMLNDFSFGSMEQLIARAGLLPAQGHCDSGHAA